MRGSPRVRVRGKGFISMISTPVSNTESFLSRARETAALLRDVRLRLERGWCQGSPALDADGRFVWPTDPAACAWCLGGAIVATAGEGELAHAVTQEIWMAIAEKERPEHPSNLAFWQDRLGRTKAHVLAVIQAAELAAGRRALGLGNT